MSTLKHLAVMSAAKVVLFAALRMRVLALEARDHRSAGIAGAVIDTIERMGVSR